MQIIRDTQDLNFGKVRLWDAIEEKWVYWKPSTARENLTHIRLNASRVGQRYWLSPDVVEADLLEKAKVQHGLEQSRGAADVVANASHNAITAKLAELEARLAQGGMSPQQAHDVLNAVDPATPEPVDDGEGDEGASPADALDAMTSEQLIDWIGERAGRRPHPNTGRDKLLEQASALV